MHKNIAKLAREYVSMPLVRCSRGYRPRQAGLWRNPLEHHCASKHARVASLQLQASHIQHWSSGSDPDRKTYIYIYINTCIDKYTRIHMSQQYEDMNASKRDLRRSSIYSVSLPKPV